MRGIRNSQLVQVGDFGLGFGNKNEEELKLKTLNKTLKAGNNLLYVIRGNHDDPAYFQKWQKIGNIRLLPDYTVLELGGYSVFLAGGAISIDRTTRSEGKNYWKEEEFVFDSRKLEPVIREIKNINIIVTHSAPSEFWPFDFDLNVHGYMMRDKQLKSDLDKDRAAHTSLLKQVSSKFVPTHWYYGHFHASNHSEYSGIKYFALGEHEIREHVLVKSEEAKTSL